MPTPAPREKAITVEMLLLVVVVARLTAHFALPQPLQGEALTNFTMARAFATGQWPGADLSHAIGYPLVIAPFFALFGADAVVAFGVNLTLALLSALLVGAVARQIGLRESGQKLALLGYALWLPGIWDCTLLVRENLGTPLMLLTAWIALRLLRQGPCTDLALGAGMVWGAGLLTGASLLPLIAAPVLAVLMGGRGWRAPVAVAALAAGAALMLAPWGWVSGALPGMSAGATFVTLSAGSGVPLPLPALDAPTMDATLGRLAMFWWPHFPDPGHDALSRAMTYMRIGEVTQYVTLFTLGFAGLVAAHTVARQRLVIGALIATFWVLGGSRMLGEGYRDPVMPLLIVLSAAVLSELIYNRPAAPARMHPLPR
jgi:MFS family permease